MDAEFDNKTESITHWYIMKFVKTATNGFDGFKLNGEQSKLPRLLREN